MSETKDEILQDIVRKSMLTSEDLPPIRRVSFKKKPLKKLRKSLESNGSGSLEDHISSNYSPGDSR